MTCLTLTLPTYSETSVTHSLFLPLPLFALWRLAAALFLLITLILNFASVGADSLQFITNWSYIGLGLLFACLAAASTFAWQRRKSASDTDADHTPPLWPTALAAAYHIFAITAPFVTIVYWGLLFDGDTDLDPQGVFRHAVNTGVVALDLILSCIVLNFSYLVFYVGYLLVYLAFIWIRFAAVQDMPYDFLDIRDDNGATRGAGRVVGVYFGVLAFSICLGAIVVGLTKLKTCRGRERSSVEESERPEEVIAI